MRAAAVSVGAPAQTTGLGIPSTRFGANGIPKQLTFEWVASTGGSTDNHEIAVASAWRPHRPAGGYWLMSAAGQVSAFGDARNQGSLHTRHAGTVVGMAASPTNRGYDLVTSEGRVFVFGDARFWGDATNLYLAAPVTAIALAPGRRGYWLVAADGGVFTYGESRFYGGQPAPAARAAVIPLTP